MGRGGGSRRGRRSPRRQRRVDATLAPRLAGALLGAVAVLTASCRAPLTDVETVYQQGRYFEVAETLAEREDEVASLSLDQQARYCLYRGMALLHIGDRAGAEHWLCLCHALDRVTPARLSQPQQRLLAQGREALGGCPHGARRRSRP